MMLTALRHVLPLLRSFPPNPEGYPGHQENIPFSESLPNKRQHSASDHSLAWPWRAWQDLRKQSHF